MIFLRDGEEITNEHINYSKIKDSNIYSDLFKFNHDIYIVNFVGYYSNNGVQYFSFPKNFEFDIDNENQSRSSMTKILKVLGKYSANNKGPSYNLGVISDKQIIYVEKILNYYNTYGFHFTKIRTHKKSKNGKINFEKTINKIQPFLYDNDAIYLDYIVDKSYQKQTFLAECMKYVIKNGCSKYYFYFQVEYNFQIDSSIFSNNKLVLSILNDYKSKLFKNYEKDIVNYLIAYFENENGTINKDIHLLTLDFNIIWEDMIGYILAPHGFENKQSFYFSKVHRLSNDSSNAQSTTISPDHINKNKKIIVDSKYYKNYDNSDRRTDYKQIVYYYYFSTLLDNTIINDQQWKSILIKPTTTSSSDINDDIIVEELRNGLFFYTFNFDIEKVCDIYLQLSSYDIFGEYMTRIE